MPTIYKIQPPEEPQVGTVLRTASKTVSFEHTSKGWLDSNFPDGQPYSWAELLHNHPEGLEDITPLRTWTLPEEPPVGTKVADRDGDEWERGVIGWGHGDDKTSSWKTVLGYAPLTEVR